MVELKSNKMRSFLTMLGVIFGVAAVIASVAIGEGAKKEALEQVELMGINNIRVVPAELEGQRLAVARQKNPEGLSRADAEALKKNCPYIEEIAPMLFVGAKPWYNGESLNFSVIAATPEYPAISNFHPSSGRFITERDMNRASRVCVVGAELQEEIFHSESPMGRSLIIGDGIYVIVGVMEDKRLNMDKTTAVSLRNLNRDVYIPLTTGLKRLDNDDDYNEVSELSIMIDNEGNIMSAAGLIGKILDRTHNGVDNYELIIPLDLLRQSQATQKRFNLVLAAIAGISLLVGGIGIMNIMLASVTQRIREIGVRRAIGASRYDVLSQFLIEAVVLSLVGGIIGIALGVFLGYVISLYAEWRTVYSLKAIAVSFLVASLVGIIFGLFPAKKAAELNPIEALRYE